MANISVHAWDTLLPSYNALEQSHNCVLYLQPWLVRHFKFLSRKPTKNNYFWRLFMISYLHIISCTTTHCFDDNKEQDKLTIWKVLNKSFCDLIIIPVSNKHNRTKVNAYLKISFEQMNYVSHLKYDDYKYSIIDEN